jgi:hypothetical protein
MIKNEFVALDRGLPKHPSEIISWRCLTTAPGADASAIHGRLGARVALLQSPILPAACSLYPEKEIFRNLPVDKPHTRIPRLTPPAFGCGCTRNLLKNDRFSAIALQRRQAARTQGIGRWRGKDRLKRLTHEVMMPRGQDPCVFAPLQNFALSSHLTVRRGITSFACRLGAQHGRLPPP